MSYYEKVGILAALVARHTEESSPAARKLGSATIGERCARLVALCKNYENASEDGRVNELARITEMAASMGLVAYEARAGAAGEAALFVGRPDYYVRMSP